MAPLVAGKHFPAGFLKDLAEVWAEHGKETMLKTAEDQPTTFFAVCARLIPSDVKLTVEQTYSGLQAEDYAILRAIKEALPSANSQSPEQVFSYVRDVLRAAQSKPLLISKAANHRHGGCDQGISL